MNASAFVFDTEFTPDGSVLGSPVSKFLVRDEAEAMAAAARKEGENVARQSAEARGVAAIDRMVAHISPVQATLALLADELRREAAELALAAARRIAGAALDANGQSTAIEAVAHAIKMLKANPFVTVSVAPEAMPLIENRLKELQGQGQAQGIVFASDAAARPGDWRVEWTDGSSAFSREDVEAAVQAVINARLQDPVEPQLELFSAA